MNKKILKIVSLVLLITFILPSSIAFAFTVNDDGSYTFSKSEMAKMFKDSEDQAATIKSLNAQIDVYKKNNTGKAAEEVIKKQTEENNALKVEIKDLKDLAQTRQERIDNLNNEAMKLNFNLFQNKVLMYTGWTAALALGIVAATK
jgi:peptidoglycan hydrolase CwlO-like protein